MASCCVEIYKVLWCHEVFDGYGSENGLIEAVEVSDRVGSSGV
jgi:hypothetical protein